jgi:hypothetical protein
MSYPHRVIGVRILLVDEESGAPIKRLYARIHETDIEAGEFGLQMKAREIIKFAKMDLGLEWRKEPEVEGTS